jgi:hypothetical protein
MAVSLRRSTKTPSDDRRIDLRRGTDIHYWCEQLGCSPGQLEAAVHNAGRMVSAVRAHLEKRRMEWRCWREPPKQ